MRGMALDASLAISSAPMVVPPAAVTLHPDLTRVRERDATRHARTADALDAWLCGIARATSGTYTVRGRP